MVLYFCDQCEYSSNQKCNLTTHVKCRHSQDPPDHQCQECPKSFKLAHNLKQHVEAVHRGLRPRRRPVDCDLCSGTFNNKGALKSHKNNVHMQIKRFQCKICNFKFASNQGLVHHDERVHKRIKHFFCLKCSKAFYRKSGLQSHQVWCNNVPQAVVVPSHKCEICRKDFWTESSLKHHKLRMHTEKQRKLVCQCGKIYVTQKWFDRHSKMCPEAIASPMSSWMPNVCYPCAVCDRTFTNITVLSRHQQSEHSTGTVQILEGRDKWERRVVKKNDD